MKRYCALFLVLTLLAGCAARPAEDGRTHILCTTYPIYLFTTAVTKGVEDIEVELLVNQQTSCLHNYTLTVRDMRAIDRADVIVMNGAGLEDFMADALRRKDAPVIDCSAGLDLLPALDHHHHDGEDETEHEADPHYWMDPNQAVSVVTEIAHQLSTLDPTRQDSYQANSVQTVQTLEALDSRLTDTLFRDAVNKAAPDSALFAPAPFYGDLYPLITFHDGFQYFADAYGLLLLRSIEEEEGSEASAKELMEVIRLVEEYHIPAIFVEKNGSRRSADVIAQETGCKVVELDMIMSGEGQGIEPYLQAMGENLAAVKEALS